MKELKLQKIEGNINHIFKKENGRVYYIHTSEGAILLNVLNYSKLASFISNEYGILENKIIGRNITLYKDDLELLVILSDTGELCFLTDKITYDFNEIYFSKNIDYIKEKYNLTPNELLSLLKEESTLKLERK